MKVGKYFTLAEMTVTGTGLKNVPTEDEIDNIRKTVEVLDIIREELGVSIKVNSGFRSTVVNNAVGGSKTSAHRLGLAADIIAPRYKEGNVYELAIAIQKILKEHNIEFDQLILEFNRWIHIGFSKTKGRKMYLTAVKNSKGRTLFKVGILKG